MLPHENRTCFDHLNGDKFSEEALERIKPTKDGVLMSDEKLTNWILEMTLLVKKQLKRKRVDFDDIENVPMEDYKLLTGLSKADFELLLEYLKGNLNNSRNRSVRNSLGMFLMMLRHALPQV